MQPSRYSSNSSLGQRLRENAVLLANHHPEKVAEQGAVSDRGGKDRVSRHPPFPIAYKAPKSGPIGSRRARIRRASRLEVSRIARLEDVVVDDSALPSGVVGPFQEQVSDAAALSHLE